MNNNQSTQFHFELEPHFLVGWEGGNPSPLAVGVELLGLDATATDVCAVVIGEIWVMFGRSCCQTKTKKTKMGKI